MATAEPSALESLEKRDTAALTEKMSILDDVGQAKGAPALYVVVSGSGREYLVNADSDACTCDDSFYRHPEGGCMHARRVQFARGVRKIPEWVQENRVDDHLGEHVTEAP